AGRPQTLPFNDVSSLAEDKAGNVWMGTNGSGLICFNRKDNSFKVYRNDPRNTNSLSKDIIVSLMVDHEDVLWIGTYYGGLNSFNGKNFTRYANKPEDPKSLGNDNIWEIYEDRDHNIWLGTLNGGLDVYNREKKEFYHYKSGELNSIHSPYVSALMQDHEGNMLIGTGYGLEILDKSSGRISHYTSAVEDPKSISSNGVQCIYQDSRGWIWIGTNGGLNRFDYSRNEFSSYREVDGLAHNSILTIVEDRDHNLWMSTPRGISRLSISGDSTFTFHNYAESDGLIPGGYHQNAAIRYSSGELFFGGPGGVSVFNPGDIRLDSTVLPVILTDFQISNRSVKVGELIGDKVILHSSISQSKKITLYPGNNLFSIEFAALNYFHPERSQYQYKLEGFNDGWITTSSTKRIATFTNLDPGEYTFRVKGTNSDGVWSSKETVLQITVLPPFWKSNLAFALYTLIAFGALLFGRRMVVARERLKFKMETERLSAQRLHEVDEMKIKFFTNVSHELRTPLTLIITPLEKIMKESPLAEERKKLGVVYKNAKRLLNLVNQLLDFKRVDGNDLKLNTSEGDIVKFIRDLVWAFSDLSEKKEIQLTFNSNVSNLEMMFDPDKIEKIVFNLLSNAFKFTPDHGRVSVDLSLTREGESGTLQIKVSDTGIGIPQDKQEKIFDRFYQNEVPKYMVNQGSGIGLSIAQEFVKLHNGTIEVVSEEGKGSTFIVTLPVVDMNTDVDEVIADEPGDESLEKNTILLIDDSRDFRSYLRDNLRNQYAILEAPNGKQGLDIAIKHLPELIVCDVMMPEMDGVELCRRIKSDSRTSHIAVILLTARTAMEQKIEGFQSGADDYITKPFSFEILESRIENLIRIQDLRHQQFQNHLDIKVSDIQVASVDEKLVRDAVKVVEDNLTNDNFSVEVMSKMLAMSRVQLYKKLYSLTGKTPIEFIRFIRIKRAAQLLEKSGLSVAEVAYQVGFHNPKYLTKYFRDVYGMLPSEFVASRKKPA
ncbi:MAG TPA: two-component regulator propeller domain-containing protein, partial [Ohtaekwangia sp.]